MHEVCGIVRAPSKDDINISEACQTGNGIVHEVCGIVRTPSKDDINKSEACKTGNRIIHFKKLFAALRTYHKPIVLKKGICPGKGRA